MSSARPSAPAARRSCRHRFAVALCLLGLTSGARAATPVIGTSTAGDPFMAGHKYYTHWANGYYWVAWDNGGVGCSFYSSPDGATWTSQGTVFTTLNPNSFNNEWATRFLGSTVIAASFDGTNSRVYRSGTLNSNGTVTWSAESAVGPADATFNALSLLIANGRPIMWRDDVNPGAAGALWRGSAITGPTWTKTAANAPAMSVGPAPNLSNGVFTAGALLPTGGASPDDLIVLRATTAAAYALGSHRLVAMKWNAATDTYDGSWYNVSTLGGTLAEDLTTEVQVNTDQNSQKRFAAVRDEGGNIHAVYVNRNGDMVHYKKAVGFNNSWSRISAGVTGAGNINMASLTAAAGGNLYLFYSKGDRIIYYRRFDGASWGAESLLQDVSATNLRGALAPMESGAGCSVGLAYIEGAASPYNIRFTLGVGTCSTLQTAQGATTVTVTAPGRFEMVLTTAMGGGVQQFYDLAEDPARAYDLAGGVAGSPTTDAVSLWTSGLWDGVWYSTGFDRSGPRLDLLEATGTRVRVRQKAAYENASGTVHRGLDGLRDLSIYPAGRTAYRFNRRSTTTESGTSGDDQELWLHGLPSPSVLSFWKAYSDSGAAWPGPGASAFVLEQIEQTGAKTDFLHIMDRPWTTAFNHLASAASLERWQPYSANETENVWWHSPTSVTVPAGAGPYSQQPGETWSFLTYFKPTNLGATANPWQDPAVTSRSADYRTPDTPVVNGGRGSQWQDADENTSAANDFYNESEGAYLFNLDPSLGLDVTMDAVVATTRYAPFLRIRQWRSLAAPSSMSVGGVTKTRDVDYKADVKPVARAQLAQDLLWHSTVQDGAAVAGPDVGSAGTVGGTPTFVAARYGNGVSIAASTQSVGFPTTDFDRNTGAVEFWYQPTYANTDGVLHDICGFSLDANNLISLEKRANNNLYFRIVANGLGTEVRATTATYSWRANDWVHLRIDWDGTLVSIVDQMRISVNGIRIPSDISQANDYNGANLGLAPFFLFGNTNGDATFAPGVYDEIHVYGASQTTPTPLANGGLTADANESLADPTRNAALGLTGVDATRRGRYLTFGADSRFRGLNVALSTVGTGVAANDVAWEYWNGTTGAWADLEVGTGFGDTTKSFTKNGNVFWTTDPANWAPYSMNGGPDLYYVRAHLPGGVNYTTPPVESQVKTDILLYQYCSDVSSAQAFVFQAPVPTVVTLASFAARGFESSVLVEWETASELDNLGFHLYRGASADGPWTKLNGSIIPGLGSSPEGRQYRWVDGGLSNGTTYFYRIEDVDRHGQVTGHGPVSATPVAGLAEPGGGGGGGVGVGGPVESPGSSPPAPERRAQGDPTQQSLRVLERSASGVTLELVTGGFYSEEQPDGTAKLVVPGFFDHAEPGRPTIPTRRLWADAEVGRGVRLVSVEPSEVVSFPGLDVSLAGKPVAVSASDGTYRASSLPATREEGRRLSKGSADGLFPSSSVFLHQTAFQGERKKAYVELAPLQVDEATGEVTLARRLVVRLAFAGRVAGELGRGSLGRSAPVRSRAPAAQVLARLATRSRGVYAVPFGEIPGLASLVHSSDLRLSRLGTPVAFHIEPRGDVFGPGSVLYFLAEGADSAYGKEAVYELALAPGGVQMVSLSPSRPAPNPIAVLRRERSFEKNAVYLPALLEARDLWLWDYGIGGGQGISYPFTLDSLSPSRAPARLALDLQGGSDTEVDPDHHVLVFVNGSLVGETRFDGMVAHSLTLDVPVSLLLGGDNTLRLENAGDTGSTATFVYLDRFSIETRGPLALVDGILEGRAAQAGRASVEAIPGSLVLDVTGPTPQFLDQATADGRLSWSAEADHHYLAVSPGAFLRPEVRSAPATALRRPANHADWIVIAPQALLGAAQPLVALRQSQGLSARAVSYEAVVDEFGYGEAGPHAIKSFLAFAFHHWQAPSPRYALLLGDASYDPKGHLPGASRPDLLPSPLTKSTYLWTAADPLYAAVNGNDSLPDIAIGRINAATVGEAQAAVGKVLAFEASGRTLAGKATLVADNGDRAGDFETSQDEIASLLASRPVERLYLSQLGIDATKAAVKSDFDTGLSLMSYVGHGSSGLWASEGILRSPDVASFAPQPAQPLVLTMTCSNGYFLSPFRNSLAESLVLADAKGAIAAFSPTGLSLDAPAQAYHRAVVVQLETGAHERLGDLLLAAQADYAATGAFPELLQAYSLLGDPGLRIR